MEVAQNEPHTTRKLDLLEGKPVIGCELSAEEAADLAKNRYPQRPFYLVESWTLLDLITTDKELALLGARGLKPLIVYSLSCGAG